MAKTHLGHSDFTETDIIENGVINETNLLTLDKQIQDLACYDKVGPDYYHISTQMAFSEKNREPQFVLNWLRHLETLKSTSLTVGYLGRSKK